MNWTRRHTLIAVACALMTTRNAWAKSDVAKGLEALGAYLESTLKLLGFFHDDILRSGELSPGVLGALRGLAPDFAELQTGQDAIVQMLRTYVNRVDTEGPTEDSAGLFEDIKARASKMIKTVEKFKAALQYDASLTTGLTAEAQIRLWEITSKRSSALMEINGMAAPTKSRLLAKLRGLTEQYDDVLKRLREFRIDLVRALQEQEATPIPAEPASPVPG